MKAGLKKTYAECWLGAAKQLNNTGRVLTRFFRERILFKNKNLC